MADTRYITANRLTEESQAIQRRGRNLVLLLGLPLALGAFFVHPLVGLVTLAGPDASSVRATLAGRTWRVCGSATRRPRHPFVRNAAVRW